ncbi:MAG: Hint domain-containing protein [Pseudomonadota bacterium]
MAWIGLRNKHGGWFKPKQQSNCDMPHEWLMRGSIVVETRASAEARPQTLFSFDRSWPKNGRFSVQALPRGGLIMVDSAGEELVHATMPYVADGRLDVLLLTYSWDSEAGWARLTLERPESDQLQSVELSDPLPVRMDDLNTALGLGCHCDIDEEVTFVAVSDMIEPVGPMPALTADVPIRTVDGIKTAATIRRGDNVVTYDGDNVPVLQVIKRTVPAKGSFRPIRLRAPYFGLRQDIVVSPQQRLVMNGSQVEYMFGREAVLVPARHLVNDRSAFLARGPDLVTYYHLLLPGHEVILSGDCPIESLYVGRLRRKPDALAKSVLAQFDRSRLPEHAKPVWPVLKPFEAVTLAMTRAA